MFTFFIQVYMFIEILQKFQPTSDEFELKFPELSRAKLKSFWAELSRAGHFNFRAETELDLFCNM